MGWYPTIIDDSLVKNLKRKKKFWVDLQNYLLEMIEKYNEKMKELGEDAFYELDSEERPEWIPSWFEEHDLAIIDVLKYSAFASDAMEHIGGWLWDEQFWPLLKKHNANGAFVLHHGDGGGITGGLFSKKAPRMTQKSR